MAARQSLFELHASNATKKRFSRADFAVDSDQQLKNW